MSRQNVTFKNARGEQLAGILEMPVTGEPRACALFAHCFTCTKNIRAATHISRALVDAGFAVLRFDFTGLGESEGDFAHSGFSANVADLIAAAEFLAGRFGAPELLIGHSLGGLAVLYAAPQIDSCTAVVTLGAPARADHVEHLFADSIDEIRARGEAKVEIGGRPFKLSGNFLDDLKVTPPNLRELNRALLVMHSPVDRIVGIDNASKIFLDARHPKSFVSLDTADHLLGNPADSTYAAGVIAAWADRYLPAVATAGAEAGEAVMAVTGAGSFHTPVNAAGHPLVADEPVAVGGEDTGPTPYGLLSAALAACTSMTLQMYARRKEIQLDEAAVSVRHQKIHAADCEACDTTSGRIDRFDREIRLIGELSDAQRARMLEIADMCPVHRTLHSEVEVRSKLAD